MISGCSFAIATHEEGLSNRRLALSFAPQNDTDMTTAATFFNSSGAPKLTDTVVVHKEQPVSTVNTSFCCISTLEVYRGKQQAIKIKHNGFSLSHSGTIVVILINKYIASYNLKW